MCDDPLHDDRNEGLWHLWRDEKGRRFAQRCPESLEREKKEWDRRSADNDRRQQDQEDWHSR